MTARDEVPEQDDRQQQELQQERYERTLACLYDALMRGCSEDDVRHLCSETGVQWRDVDNYLQPILRPTGGPSTLALPF